MSAPALARPQSRTTGKNSLMKWIPAALAIVLLVAMAMSTKFLTAQEAADLQPKVFDAKEWAAENYDKAIETLSAKGTDLPVLAPAVLADPAAAAQQYGRDMGNGSYAFPVKVTGTVESADANFMILTVAGMPEGSVVRIPLGTAINGTPVRDAAGYKFADFPGQTQYQQAANELKAKMTTDVIGKLQPASMTGKTITVIGAYSLPGAANSYIVQPMKITEG
jgi:predicted lipoprotein